MIESNFGKRRPSLDEVAPEPREVTAWGSRWNDLRCPRLYKLRHIDRIAPMEPSDALEIGTMFHRAAAVYYGYCAKCPVPASKHREAGARAARLAADKIRGYATAWEAAGSREGMEVADKALTLWLGYIARWGEASGYEMGNLVMVEQVLQAKLPGPEWNGSPPLGDGLGADVTARLDTAMVIGSGRAWVLEHKSASQRTRDIVEGFALDMQLLRQAWLWSIGHAQGLLPPLGGIVVDLAFKLKIPEYERIEHIYDDRDIARYLHTMRWYEYKRHAAAMAGWPHDFTQCRWTFGLCSFYAYCLAHGQPAMGYVKLGEET